MNELKGTQFTGPLNLRLACYPIEAGLPGSGFYFDLASNGEPAGLREYRGGTPLKRFKAVRPSLRSRAGRYYSPELAASHTVRVSGWHIVVNRRRRRTRR